MPDSVIPVPAATVMVLRDGADGIEVFMLQRHLDSDFVGGAYVFPGGKVDEQDKWLDADLADATTEDVGFRAAAVRETFEESGILLTTRPLPREANVEKARMRLSARGKHWDWRPWLRRHDAQLALSSLAWWSWWVTPEGPHRRFDTRFYLCAAQRDHNARHDGTETTDSFWITPVEALEAAGEGSVSIILPTRKNLEGLLVFDSAADAVEATKARPDDPPRIEPVMTEIEGEILINHPSFDRPERF